MNKNIVESLNKLRDILYEGQYKYSNTRHIRRQSQFPSSIGPSRSFGGVKERTVKELKKDLKEGYCTGLCGTLTGDLTAHDNSTIVPKGSDIKVVDGDPSLPDIEWDGNVINVDGRSLAELLDPYESFENRLVLMLLQPNIVAENKTITESTIPSNKELLVSRTQLESHHSSIGNDPVELYISSIGQPPKLIGKTDGPIKNGVTTIDGRQYRTVVVRSPHWGALLPQSAALMNI